MQGPNATCTAECMPAASSMCQPSAVKPPAADLWATGLPCSPPLSCCYAVGLRLGGAFVAPGSDAVTSGRLCECRT